MKLKILFENMMTNVDFYLDVKSFLQSKYNNKKLLFHGTPRINAIHKIEDIKPTKNVVESKYLYLSQYIGTALTYCTISNYEFTDESGIVVFKINGGKKYNFSKTDKSNSSDWKSFNDILDKLKNDGYDYVVGTQNNQEMIILNNSILKIVDKIYINKLLDKLIK